MPTYRVDCSNHAIFDTRVDCGAVEEEGLRDVSGMSFISKIRLDRTSVLLMVRFHVGGYDFVSGLPATVSANQTHIATELPIHLVKLVEYPRIEKWLFGRDTRRAKVRLHDRVVSRVKLEDHQVAWIRLDRFWLVPMRIRLGTDLDGVRRFSRARLCSRGLCGGDGCETLSCRRVEGERQQGQRRPRPRQKATPGHLVKVVRYYSGESTPTEGIVCVVFVLCLFAWDEKTR